MKKLADKPASPPDPTGQQAEAVLDLAARLRMLREKSGLSVRRLAARIGTSASFVSQLERGLTGASTSTLMRIADAYGLSMSALFDPDDQSPPAPHRVLRRAERPALPMVQGCRKTLLSERPLADLEIYHAEFLPGGTTGAESYTHGDASEVLIVLTGRVELTLDGNRLDLGLGDSIEYRSSVPHRVRNVAASPAEVLFIISPPTSSPGDLSKYLAVPAQTVAGEDTDKSNM